MKQNNWRFELYGEDDRVKHEKYLSEQPYNKELDDLLVEFGRKERAVQRQDNRWRSIFELNNKSSDLCSLEERVINDISKQLIRKCVEMLPPIQRKRILMHYWLGLSQSEIAEIEGVRQSNIARSIYNARNKIMNNLLTFRELPHNFDD